MRISCLKRSGTEPGGVSFISLRGKPELVVFMDVDYYDKILAGISLSLLAGVSAGFLTSLPLQYSAGAGAGVSMLFMYHGMFRNGPLG